ncbi:MAG: hypothetical protein Q4P05_05440 [Actinomycetaceae bacterium]|nr:hypothetical protein [Actinomycetaceae bacterium]
MNLSLDLSFGDDYALDAQAVRLAAGFDRLADLRDRMVREFPALSDLESQDVQETLMLRLRDSVRKRERLWLMSMDEKERAEWEQWLSPDVLRELGPRQIVRGKEVIPIGVAPVDLMDFLVERKTPRDIEFLRGALHGVDGLVLSTRVYNELMGLGIPVVQRTRFTRLMTNPKFLAYLVVLIYSALRVLPVTFIKEFEGSLVMLWAIDLITAIPYTWGVLTMVTAARFRMRVFGMVVTIVTFMAPYVYFGLHGRHYPAHVILIIVALILATFALEGFKIWLDRRNANRLRFKRS